MQAGALRKIVGISRIENAEDKPYPHVRLVGADKLELICKGNGV